ncbi:MAG TPA: ATP-binding protein [Jatrophihabitantaceae bacterium]|jgi:two-component system sensor histidine kinase KdpD
MTYRRGRPVAAAIVLPAAFGGLLLIGVIAVAADLHGTSVLALACVLVATTSFVAEPLVALPLAVIGWFAVAGFDHAPYGDLHADGAIRAGGVLAFTAGVAACAGIATRGTLESVNRWGAITPRRLVAGLGLAAVLLPALTAVLAALRAHLALVDDLLLYLLAVLAVTIVGGFWPAVIAAVAAGLLLNWFFTPPVHTWTIEAPENMLALLLFVTVAVTVSSVVHLAAQRSALAAERAKEASTLLVLARTVLGGDDTPQAVLDHLSASLGVQAELRENSGGRWVRVAGAPLPRIDRQIDVGEDLRLLVAGNLTGVNGRMLEGYAAQAAAAVERHRLRIQAGQAEALAEGNRIRTALLTAVSHDLRTPLSAVKAAVTTLRQTDVVWSPEDQASLLATIEEGADRLDSLIANLLDMSRIHTGSLSPFIRPTALDEVAPLVVHGLDDAQRLNVAIPDALPLLTADPGLLERALANLVANALRYSPPDRPPTLTAQAGDGIVSISVIDHGPGIAPEQREQVFEPFQQLGDQRTGGGVGLGLAVAKGFVEALGGRITARTTPGGGLTMRVDLPTAASTRDVAGAAQ